MKFGRTAERLRIAAAGALKYLEPALKILEKAYGPENPATKTVAENLETLKPLYGIEGAKGTGMRHSSIAEKLS